MVGPRAVRNLMAKKSARHITHVLPKKTLDSGNIRRIPMPHINPFQHLPVGNAVGHVGFVVLEAWGVGPGDMLGIGIAGIHVRTDGETGLWSDCHPVEQVINMLML